MNKLKLGVCYYPEHWDSALWPKDLDMMADLGISHVRLAEFAWGQMQPGPKEYDFSWLDQVIEMAGSRGLKVVLCTPTATPPAWLINKHPEILPTGADGRVRQFGSRRHYSFSSTVYQEYSRAITEQMAQRYGKNPTVVAWQTDNEFACHNTARSYGEQELQQFQQWLEHKYKKIEELNRAWGNDFWDQNYQTFQQIPLPNNQVAEFNPAHKLDFYRFASAEVVAFNKQQTDILRRHCPTQPITHNMMGFCDEFDHFAMAEDLDFGSWDNYPLGFLDFFHSDAEDKRLYYDIGHPDISAFYHDLYRCLGHGRLWIMEQQPGPVNWANYNPVPVDGAVKFWSWQAFAHGAELVSYFRWRQAPFAQEQMHAGILRSDSQPAQAYYEVKELQQELAQLPELEIAPAEVALLYDYETLWHYELLPQSQGFSSHQWMLDCYGGLRRWGLNVDIVSRAADFSKYKLVVAPSYVTLDSALLAKVKQAHNTHFLWGPRSGSKDENFCIPRELPPGELQELIPVTVSRVATTRPEVLIKGSGDFGSWQGALWREYIDTELKPRAHDSHGGIFYSHNQQHYLAARLDRQSVKNLIQLLLKEAKVKYNNKLKEGQRVCATKQGNFLFDFTKRRYSLPV